MKKSELKSIIREEIIKEIKVIKPTPPSLEKTIMKNKKALSQQFNLGLADVSWGDEGEPVVLMDDDGNQVDFIKKEDWEYNKQFYTNSKEIGEITLDNMHIIYIINSLYMHVHIHLI